jgi:hypothetical protein
MSWPHADAIELAAAVVATCSAILAELAPVVGRRGVAALFQRSLARSAAAHPWLQTMVPGAPMTVDLDALQRLLAAQACAAAVDAARSLLQAFDDLLASLIGPALTEQLLGPARAPGARAAGAPAVPAVSRGTA